MENPYKTKSSGSQNTTQTPKITAPEQHLLLTEEEFDALGGRCPFCKSENIYDHGYEWLWCIIEVSNEYECNDCGGSWREELELVRSVVVLNTEDGEVELAKEGESSAIPTTEDEITEGF